MPLTSCIEHPYSEDVLPTPCHHERGRTTNVKKGAVRDISREDMEGDPGRIGQEVGQRRGNQ